jgi:uncharacterized protein
MQINKQPADINTIQSYSDSEIKLNSIIYNTNLIITSDKIISDWPVNALSELKKEAIESIIDSVEIIIVGHNNTGIQPPMAILQDLSKKRIGLECMSIGAACRTFNVLLSEDRKAALAIIF